MEVLIVEDDRALARSLGRVLEQAGYTCRQVHDGVAALEAIGKAHPDLVLIDLLLPKKDGHSVISMLGASEATRGIPIIAMSGVMRGSDTAKSVVAAGARAFLDKPFESKVLLDRITRLIGKPVAARDEGQRRLARSRQDAGDRGALERDADPHDRRRALRARQAPQGRRARRGTTVRGALESGARSARPETARRRTHRREGLQRVGSPLEGDGQAPGRDPDPDGRDRRGRAARGAVDAGRGQDARDLRLDRGPRVDTARCTRDEPLLRARGLDAAPDRPARRRVAFRTQSSRAGSRRSRTATCRRRACTSRRARTSRRWPRCSRRSRSRRSSARC